jgi:hypothetical protein
VIDLTFITGEITYDELSSLKDIDLPSQVNSLKEDMLQVSYSVSLLIDVGWYPSFNASGHFQIRAIKDYEWDAPLYCSRANTIPLLIEKMMTAQTFINKYPMIKMLSK